MFHRSTSKEGIERSNHKRERVKLSLLLAVSFGLGGLSLAGAQAEGELAAEEQSAEARYAVERLAMVQVIAYLAARTSSEPKGNGQQENRTEGPSRAYQREVRFWVNSSRNHLS